MLVNNFSEAIVKLSDKHENKYRVCFYKHIKRFREIIRPVARSLKNKKYRMNHGLMKLHKNTLLSLK